MDQKKKSALTAALSGAPPDALGQADPAGQPKDDTFAFPCLSAEGGVDVNGAAAGLESLNLERRASLAGSAPTASRLSNTFTVSSRRACAGSGLACVC